MKLYIARHGETMWNRENRILGRTDKPLNETGEKQAAALAAAMADKGIEVIVSSPLLRARQTADAVAKTTGAPVVEDARLVEQAFGIYEGASRFDEGYVDAKMDFGARLPGGGESLFDMAHRVYAALEDIRQAYAGKTVFIATHNSVMRVAKTFFEDVSAREFRLLAFPNAEALEYEL